LHVALYSELSCFYAITILLSVALFHSIYNFFNAPTKPDTIQHNVMLSTKWRAISVLWVIARHLLSERDGGVCHTGWNMGTAGFTWLCRANGTDIKTSSDVTHL
jgi:hypothetical protein